MNSKTIKNIFELAKIAQQMINQEQSDSESESDVESYDEDSDIVVERKAFGRSKGSFINKKNL